MRPEDRKSLSKNLMYAPLATYHKSAFNTNSGTIIASKSNHLSHYKSNKNSVVKSLKESSLVSIFHLISCDYHRSHSTVNCAKNNGSRPLALTDAEDRIRQRAVTLIGGGINASIPVTKTTFRFKRRRKRSWEDIEPVLGKSTLGEVEFELESVHLISFLKKLNLLWNEHVWKLILKDKAMNCKHTMSDNALEEIKARLGVLMKTRIYSKEKRSSSCNRSFNDKDDYEDDALDLVGAHVLIQSCKSHTSLVGKYVVLVGETTSTYRVASHSLTKTRESSRNNDNIRGKSGSEEGSSVGIGKKTCDVKHATITTLPDFSSIQSRSTIVEIFHLPKVGLSMQLILPVLVSEIKQVDFTGDQILNPKEDSIHESVISVPDNAVCISIAANATLL